MDLQDLIKRMSSLADELNGFDNIADSDFSALNIAYQKLINSIKKISYSSGDRNSIEDFEFKWVAQNLQFMIDILPDIHRVLLKYYSRKDELELADIGAGSGAGSNLISQLHTDRMIYSKINVSAIDYIDHRLKWAKSQYPYINYQVADLYNLDSKRWDLVVCSHCLEHVEQPERFLSELVRICKGFLFVYTPFNEINLIPAHRNRITEELYNKYTIENLKIFNSMAWHPDIPEDEVILSVIDCRS